MVEKNDLEKREVYTDRYPLLSLRNRISKLMIIQQMACKGIIETDAFENISIAVILCNSIVMIFDDSKTGDEPSLLFETIEFVFLILYTIEMVLKITGMGFYFGENAYLKDEWNILDFVIVISSLPPYLLASGDEQSVDVIKREM